MSTLIILVASFCIILILNKYGIKNYFTVSLMGRTALAIMLLFAGTSHFYKTDEMVQMMPDFLPNKIQLVYLTGVLEIIGAIGLIINRVSKLTSVALILFLVAILPANIIGSIKKVVLGGMENGPGYLYFRVPLQLLFIAWTYYFGIYLIEKPLKENTLTAKNT